MARVNVRSRLPLWVLCSWVAACHPSKAPAPEPPQDAPSPTAKSDASGRKRLNLGPAAEPEPEGPRKRPAADPVRDLEGALQALNTGQPEAASAFLEGHVKQAPRDLDPRRALARALVAHGAYERAAAVLADPAGQPKHLDILRDRARVAALRGRYPEAEGHLRSILKASPGDLDAQGRLLALLVTTGRRGDESRALMEGLYDAFDDGKIKSAADHLAVARAALARGSSGAFQDANDVLGEAEKMVSVASGDPLADEIVLLRGDVFLEKYDAAEASVSYGQVLERDSWHPEAMAGIARALLSEMRFHPAATQAEEVLAVNPHHPDALAILARVALVEGRREEAETLVRDRVFAVDPGHPQGHAVLAALALLRGDRKTFDTLRDAVVGRDRTGNGFFVPLSELLGFLHLYADIETVLADAAERDPKNPYVQSARGLNLLRLGDEVEGRAALEAAWRRDKYNQRTLNVLDLYEKTIDTDYVERTRGDLTIRLPARDAELLGDHLFESVQRARKALDRHYGMHPGPLRLEFFNDHEQFSVRTVGVPSLGAVAVCFGKVITFIGPYTGRHNLDAVIWHELGHVYAIEKSNSRVPRWFTEGLSEWESEVADPAWEREAAELLATARARGKLYRLGELDLGFIRASSGRMMDVAYSISTYAVRYLGTTYGRKALLQMLEAYGRGEDTAQAMQKALGKPLPQVEAEFEAWLTTALERRISGWVPGSEQSKDPRDLLMRKAIRQASSDDFEGATQTLENLVAQGGDGYTSRMALAQIQLDGPNPEAARVHLEKARQFNREAIDPLRQLADLAAKAGKHKEQAAHYRAMMAVDSNDVRPAVGLLLLGVGVDNRGWRSEAVTRARAIFPTHPVVLATRALDATRRDRKRAEVWLDRAIEDLQQGGDAAAVAVAALAAQKLGRADQARKLAKQAAPDDTLPKPLAGRVKALASGS